MEHVVSEQSPFKSSEAETNFSSLIDEYAERYFEVSTSYENMYKRLLECIEFLNNTKVPFCYEYAKNSYKMTFRTLRREIDSLGDALCKLPDTISEMSYLAVQDTEHSKKKMCMNYLDNLFSYYHLSVDNFLCDIENYAKAGLEFYQQSQMV